MADIQRADCFGSYTTGDAICAGDGTNDPKSGPACSSAEICKRASVLTGGKGWDEIPATKRLEVEQQLAAPAGRTRQRPDAEAPVASTSAASLQADLDQELAGLGGDSAPAPAASAQQSAAPVAEPVKKRRGRRSKAEIAAAAAQTQADTAVAQTEAVDQAIQEPAQPIVQVQEQAVVEPQEHAQASIEIKWEGDMASAVAMLAKSIDRLAMAVHTPIEKIAETIEEAASPEQRKRGKKRGPKAAKEDGKKRGPKAGKKRGRRKGSKNKKA
jgi:hypothetical protein